MIAIDFLKIRGHKNVKGTHKTTLEFTKDTYLTPRGDCIIGIYADKGVNDLKDDIKRMIKNEGFIYIVINVCGIFDIISARGSSKLTLSNKNKMIIRKSSFISDATLAINSNKSAFDIKREIIKGLQNEHNGLVYIVTSDIPLKNEEILGIVINFNPFESIKTC
ncbi:DUF371 domain-containing protein [Acidianus brierleyi]|uniref:DUF371 domain-containing protein n=1 Tax=Acidianus brierleyi TaxID=41673 RepID=A0A2U9IBS2_9CREN|nr:DUF371 domain-containing protein [Acidianus brierleyi]AWR93462.1 DUF371 domain-containing protein [Acidianus brierleyi]